LGVITSQHRVGGEVEFAPYGTRHRAACELRAIVAFVEPPGGQSDVQEVWTAHKARTGQYVSRPPGPQSLGRWRVTAPTGSRVSFVLRYECHALWDTMATVGPWGVE
jgi:hypothetical protein